MDYEKFYKKYKKHEHYTNKGYVRIEWIVGGQSGGSCWDTGERDPHYNKTVEEQPEFLEFRQIIFDIHPDILARDLIRLEKTLLENNEYTENDYYGNYTNYRTIQFSLQALYDELKKLGAFKDDPNAEIA